MYQNAEALHGPQWSVRGDPRISPVGRILRFLHLDELPQLINVVRGDMSLVGPRPERPEFVSLLADLIPNYVDRLAVLPGITGLAQINFPPDESIGSVRRKVAVDRQYVIEATGWLDARILFCTGLRMMGVRHGRAARWLRLEHTFDDAVFELDALDTSGSASSIAKAPVGVESACHSSRKSRRHHSGAVPDPAFVLTATAVSSDVSTAIEGRQQRRRPR
jgi:hypothetical protein